MGAGLAYAPKVNPANLTLELHPKQSLVFGSPATEILYGGAAGGGKLVCEGTPEVVAQCAQSYTGQYLKPMLEKGVRGKAF